MKVAVIVPVCNAEPWLQDFLPALGAQRPEPDSVVFIDSASTDHTTELLRRAGYPVHRIARSDFNHGGTRRLGCQLVDADVYVFLTQDAILDGADAIARLVAPIWEYSDIGVSYGRQRPHRDATPLGAHARLFNYPAVSQTRSRQDSARYGIKTCFSSDSFCAYRSTALDSCGGFPLQVIGSEDAYVAGRMLLAGWRVHYAADASVRHSHDYTLLQQLRRYFDIGVFYGREGWLEKEFGSAGGEGVKFVKSEIRYLVAEQSSYLIPYALAHTIAKLTGYRLGKAERFLPSWLKRRVGMNRLFWRDNRHV